MSRLPTSTPRLADSVAAELEKRILEGSFKAGAKLPAERSLALEMGVSRPSLREAIQKLVSKGLLSTRHGGGTFVTDRLEAQFADPWQDMVNSQPLLHRDLFEFRQMLESQTARLAADRATDVDIELLDAAHARLATAYSLDRMQECVDADAAFHQVIAESAHNALISHLTASLTRILHGHVSDNLAYLHDRPQRWEQLQAQHYAIWQAIRQHQTDLAAQLAGAHIEYVRASMADNAHVDQSRQSALRRVHT